MLPRIKLLGAAVACAAVLGMASVSGPSGPAPRALSVEDDSGWQVARPSDTTDSDSGWQ